MTGSAPSPLDDTATTPLTLVLPATSVPPPQPTTRWLGVAAVAVWITLGVVGGTVILAGLVGVASLLVAVPVALAAYIPVPVTAGAEIALVSAPLAAAWWSDHRAGRGPR